ncbi:hypothetical protein [Streptomyces dysideae]|uniref:hypothetical protein n=1 Tax=Streptomyces dysideae TaxID=909626 RepID=UPI0018FEB541|nr:hypothetical protein [Streptomyces dysideae]
MTRNGHACGGGARTGRTTLLTAAEILAWWAVLAALWLVLVSTADVLELAACRAVTGR